MADKITVRFRPFVNAMIMAGMHHHEGLVARYVPLGLVIQFCSVAKPHTTRSDT